MRIPSFALLLYISRTLLSHGFSEIIEGNFKKGSDTEEFGKQLKGSGITVVEIFCKAPGELLIERFMNRMNERHAIHPRIMPVRFLRELQLNGMTPLSIGKILEVDVPPFRSPYFVGCGKQDYQLPVWCAGFAALFTLPMPITGGVAPVSACAFAVLRLP